ncbi:hypothetical protein [Frigoribacterium faeni]|uniref:Uncharacterized protein n=1 Tax=Frigoribacterium faeni TaxID=145483 RepID=A0A7W3JL09_9MICO|nr:hypothetical protein [Frigoribacterium faeni]MBA8814639.1 hypothetical protein [Frigoribacterium faeni]GEK83533.1 hypothetical protein FFA01_18420 [Frigoribacterium faeni]
MPALPPIGRADAVALFRDQSRRAVLFTMLSVPAATALAVGKGALFVLAPSASLLGTVLFAVGVIALKVEIIRCHVVSRRAELRAAADGPTGPATSAVLHERTYRLTGIVLVALSLMFVVSFLPLVTGSAEQTRYDRWPAIILATVTFAEIGLAVHGVVSARRNRDPLAEAVKLTNLAAGFVLLTLAQSALISLEPVTDPGPAGPLSGVAFGSLPAAVGVSMLVRSRSRSRASSRTADDLTDERRVGA